MELHRTRQLLTRNTTATTNNNNNAKEAANGEVEDLHDSTSYLNSYIKLVSKCEQNVFFNHQACKIVFHMVLGSCLVSL